MPPDASVFNYFALMSSVRKLLIKCKSQLVAGIGARQIMGNRCMLLHVPIMCVGLTYAKSGRRSNVVTWLTWGSPPNKF